jgi:hypothetical protein
MAEAEDSKPKLNLIINHAGTRASRLAFRLLRCELVLRTKVRVYL